MSDTSQEQVYETTTYAVGICTVSVCSSDPDRDRILEQVNRTHPTGLDHGWDFDEAETFRTGEPNPCPCDQHPDTHLHYLLSC